jgi:hypothetical protein
LQTEAFACASSSVVLSFLLYWIRANQGECLTAGSDAYD